jgi:hypothetical protein
MEKKGNNDEVLTKKSPSEDEVIQWIKKSSIGILLRDSWKELNLKSKREFYFSLYRVARWDPVTNKPMFGYSPVSMWPNMISLNLLKFFGEIFDWKMGGQNWRLEKLERIERRKREKLDSIVDQNGINLIGGQASGPIQLN